MLGASEEAVMRKLRWRARVGGTLAFLLIVTTVLSTALTLAQAGETVTLYDAIRDGRAAVTGILIDWSGGNCSGATKSLMLRG